MQLPTIDGERLADLKEFKLKRSLVHLQMASPNTNRKNWISSTDNRDQRANVVSPDSSNTAADNDNNNCEDEVESDDTNNINTTEVKVRLRMNGRLKPKPCAAVLNSIALKNCKEASSAVEKSKYIANHHFHPAILQAMLDQGKSSIDCMPVQLIQDLDLVDNGYTNADLFHGEVPEGKTSPVYVPVPSYKDAKDDYKLVSNRWRLNCMIKECRMKRRGNSTLAPR